MDPLLSDRTARSPDALPASMAPFREALAAMRAQAERERQLVETIQSLLARVSALEDSLGRLQMCTVQQFVDGRLYLPAGNKLRIEIPGNWVGRAFHEKFVSTLDVANVRAEAPHPASAGSPRPCGHVLGSPAFQPRPYNANLPYTNLPAGNASSIAAQMGARRDWQSMASSNNIADPRRLPSQDFG